jgi:hypothetical protein
MLPRLIHIGKKWVISFFYPQKKSYKVLFAVILVVVTLLILGVNVYRQREILFSYHWQFNFLPFAIAFVLFSLTLLFGSLVWSSILNSLGKITSYKKHLYYYILSNVAKRVPGTVWYVASRAQLYTGEGIDVKMTALASGIELAIITLAGVLTVLIFSNDIIYHYRLSPFIFILFFLIGVFILQPRFINWFIKLLTKQEIKIKYTTVILGIATYAISWILGGLLLFEITNIIYPIPQNQIFHIIGIWVLVGNLSTLLLFSPTNFGITELGISFLMSGIVPFSIAVVIAITARVLIITFEICWAGIFMGVYHFRENR